LLESAGPDRQVLDVDLDGLPRHAELEPAAWTGVTLAPVDAEESAGQAGVTGDLLVVLDASEAGFCRSGPL